MKKQVTFILAASLLSGFIFVNFSNAANLANKLKGKILLQVESNGEAWYVNPADEKRYSLGRPDDAFNLMRELGIGITNSDLNKIKIADANLSGEDSDDDGLSNMIEDSLNTDKNKVDTDGDGYSDKDEVLNGYNPNGTDKLNIDNNFATNQNGKILLQIEQNGEAWYVNSDDSKRYFLGRANDAFNLMRELGLGISNDNLVQIEENKITSLTHIVDIDDSPFGFLGAPELIIDPPSEFNVETPYDFAIDLNVKWYRGRPFLWSQIQPNITEEIYLWPDKYIEDIPSQINLVAGIFIGSSNPIDFSLPINNNYNEYAQNDSYLPKDEEKYRNFIVELVERYDGDENFGSYFINETTKDIIRNNPIKYWQIENEPPAPINDERTEFLNDYAEFLKITYDYIKEADSNAKVIIGGAATGGGNISYFEETFIPILNDLEIYDEIAFDIFDFHWFGNATGDYKKTKEFYITIKNNLEERNLLPESFWITEMGTYSGDLNDTSWGGLDFQSEKHQAIDLIKRYVYSFSFEIKKIFWAFGIVEGFPSDGVNGSFWDFTGLVYDGIGTDDKGKGVKKLAYYTFKLMVEKLEGSDWDSVETIQESNDAYVYKFTNTETKKKTWVAWNDELNSQTVSIDVGSIKSIKITEAVPKYETGQEVTNFDTAFNTEIKTVNNGKITITLGEIPVFIEEN